MKPSETAKKAVGDISNIGNRTLENIAAYLVVHIGQGRKLKKEN